MAELSVSRCGEQTLRFGMGFGQLFVERCRSLCRYPDLWRLGLDNAKGVINDHELWGSCRRCGSLRTCPIRPLMRVPSYLTCGGDRRSHGLFEPELHTDHARLSPHSPHDIGQCFRTSHDIGPYHFMGDNFRAELPIATATASGFQSPAKHRKPRKPREDSRSAAMLQSASLMSVLAHSCSRDVPRKPAAFFLPFHCHPPRRDPAMPGPSRLPPDRLFPEGDTSQVPVGPAVGRPPQPSRGTVALPSPALHVHIRKREPVVAAGSYLLRSD
jgi:hypothetical protein